MQVQTICKLNCFVVLHLFEYSRLETVFLVQLNQLAMVDLVNNKILLNLNPNQVHDRLIRKTNNNNNNKQMVVTYNNNNNKLNKLQRLQQQQQQQLRDKDLKEVSEEKSFSN